MQVYSNGYGYRKGRNSIVKTVTLHKRLEPDCDYTLRDATAQ